MILDHPYLCRLVVQLVQLLSLPFFFFLLFFEENGSSVFLIYAAVLVLIDFDIFADVFGDVS